LQILLLELSEGRPYLAQVEAQHLFLDFFAHHGLFLLDHVPRMPADCISLNLPFALVDVPRLLEEDAVDASDNVSRREVKPHLLHPVDLVPNVVRSLLHECKLRDLSKLVVNDFILAVPPRLEGAEYFKHEELEEGVCPFVVAVGNLDVLLDLEELLESLVELQVQEVLEDLCLHVTVQLVEISQLRFQFEAGELVIFPVKLKVVFDLFLELPLEKLTIVKLDHEDEEPVEIILLLVVGCHVGILLQ
jgi:hypothetical protein